MVEPKPRRHIGSHRIADDVDAIGSDCRQKRLGMGYPKLHRMVARNAGKSEPRLVVGIDAESGIHERAEVQLPVHKGTSARRAAVNKNDWMSRAAVDVESFHPGNVDGAMFEIVHDNTALRCS